jgi:hypothetical protein
MKTKPTDEMICRLVKSTWWLAILVIVLTALISGTAWAQDEVWWAEFYSNTSLSGVPMLTRTDNRIDFDWGCGAPAAGVPADNFSVRWSRSEWFESGTYRFSARADDGFRLWVGEMLVIDAWHDQQGGWSSREIYISPGVYPVRVEYYEHTGGALVTLAWERLSGDSGWQGQYYDNIDLNGDPVLRRTDSAIDFDWGDGSPYTSVPADSFSVRWSYTVGFAAGTYRFFTSTDDGVRLWVDNQLLIDAWHNQALPNARSGDIFLGQGLHHVLVEYYEDGGSASAHVWWQRRGHNFSGWKGEYYSNRDLAGGPALIRDDADVAFDWYTGSPADWIPSDDFSIRWSREMNFSPGYYRLSVRSDDGVRVWLDSSLVIDKWYVMANELHYVDGIYLTGLHQLKVEYFEHTGLARIRFWISPAGAPGGSTPPPPVTVAVIVDDTDSTFVRGGSTTAWHTALNGHGGHLTWTRNNSYERPNFNWAQWNPSLPPGKYEVFAYIPAQHANTTNARYWIKHAAGYSLHAVDQSLHYGEWVSLGTYGFNGNGGREYVSLSDITYEPYLSRTIAFDAIKWEPR